MSSTSILRIILYFVLLMEDDKPMAAFSKQLTVNMFNVSIIKELLLMIVSDSQKL